MTRRYCRFQLMGVLIASPVALLVALWGMSELKIIDQAAQVCTLQQSSLHHSKDTSSRLRDGKL
jgi:hypothetical protein